MSIRIAIAGISHESLTFSPIPVGLEDFGVLRGEEILNAGGGGILEILGCPGLTETVRKLRVEPVPILVATSTAPGGWIAQDTYLRLRGDILDGLSRAGRLDGVCLLMHGGMLVENMWSGETDLVRSVRAAVGRDVLVSARLDLHANITEEFANKTDLWAAFRTAPHRDGRETLERALSMLAHCVRSDRQPRPVFIRLPMLLQGEKAMTDAEPMRHLLAMASALEERPGILNAQVLVGFAWMDAPHAGSSVVVIADGREHLAEARQAAAQLAQAMWDRREQFTFGQEVAATVDEAIEAAEAAPESTVFLTDSGDNVTAGAPGDGTYFLSRLLAKGVPDAVFAGIADAEAARICLARGLGATVDVSLGGKMDRAHGDPLRVRGLVEHVHRPDPASGQASIVTLRVRGVRILLADRRKAWTTLVDFTQAGIDPLGHKIVVVKLGYLFPELRDIAPREILVLSPGCADMDLTRLPYKYATRPVFPLDNDFDWAPVITNIHGSVE